MHAEADRASLTLFFWPPHITCPTSNRYSVSSHTFPSTKVRWCTVVGLRAFAFFLSQTDHGSRRVFSAVVVAQIFSNTAVCAEALTPVHCRQRRYVLNFVVRGVRDFAPVHKDRIFFIFINFCTTNEINFMFRLLTKHVIEV